MSNISEKILYFLNYENGFFIECGANDGIFQSNTYNLEKILNWRGILIEPSKIAFENCKKNRSMQNIFFNCALVSDDKIGNIKGDFNGNPMASINGTRLNSSVLHTVECRTLTSILNNCNFSKIDFFSLDVEGYELEVLKGLDFNRYCPKYILVEIYEKDKELIFNFLENNNYILIENLSNFNLKDNPLWDGTHNDYLFKFNK